MSEKPMNLLNLVEAAEQVGCKPITLRKAAIHGRLSATKISKTWLVTPEALEEWRSRYWGFGKSVPRTRKTPSQTA